MTAKCPKCDRSLEWCKCWAWLEKSKIPAALIPELVEWLMGEDTGADVAIQFWVAEEFVTKEYDTRPMKEMNDLCINNPYMSGLRSALTAALEAFNEREETKSDYTTICRPGVPTTPISTLITPRVITRGEDR